MAEIMYTLTNASSAAQAVGSGRSRSVLFKNGDKTRVPESQMTDSDYNRVNTGTLTSSPVLGASSPAEVVTTNADTYAITVTVDDKVKFTIDGVSVPAITLTAGAARTAAQIVADLNGDVEFAALALASKLELGATDKVRITSKRTVGNSIEVEAIAADAYTILGLAVGVIEPSADVQAVDAEGAAEMVRHGVMVHKLVQPAPATDHALPFKGSELVKVLYHAYPTGAISADDSSTVTVGTVLATGLTKVNFATDHSANLVYVYMRP